MVAARRETVSIYIASNEPLAFAQENERLLRRFRILQGGQAILEKLGYMLMINLTESETKILPKFKKLDLLIEQGNPAGIQAQMLDLETELREYERWIEQANVSLSPYELRQHIKQTRLKREDILAMVRYLSHKQPNSTDGRDKFELLLTELCKDLPDQEKTNLLQELFPEPSLLSPAAVELIERIYALMAQLESIIEFIQLIEGGYLSQARSLKLELGQSFWHPETLWAVSSLNLAIKSCFSNLLYAERHFIIVSCRKLLMAGVNTCKLGSGILSVEAAARLAERADELLEGNYYTNVQPLHKLALVGRWMRANSQLIDEQTLSQPGTTSMATVPQPKIENGLILEPLCTAPRDVTIEEMEQQLKARIEEISQILASRPYYFSHKPVQLKHTELQFNDIEVQAITSPGNLVDSRARLQQYSLIRRSVALLAELQESAGIYNKESGKKRSRYYFSLPTMTYYLKQARQIMSELEKMIQTARQCNDLPTAVDLVDQWNKLETIFRANCRIINDLFPMLKLKHLGITC
jgi:hypothetical protein